MKSARSARGAVGRSIVAGLRVLLTLWTAQASAADPTVARELVRQAKAFEGEQRDDTAVRRYMDALSVDPACAEAYLGLGALRLRKGDWREAERVYDVALTHTPDLEPARIERARVRFLLGRRAEARRDVLEGHEEDATAWRTWVGFYDGTRESPAKLATWRRIGILAEAQGNAALAREARSAVRALTLVVGTADPVAAPTEPSPIRALVARLALPRPGR